MDSYLGVVSPSDSGGREGPVAMETDAIETAEDSMETSAIETSAVTMVADTSDRDVCFILFRKFIKEVCYHVE